MSEYTCPICGNVLHKKDLMVILGERNINVEPIPVDIPVYECPNCNKTYLLENNRVHEISPALTGPAVCYSRNLDGKDIEIYWDHLVRAWCIAVRNSDEILYIGDDDDLHLFYEIISNIIKHPTKNKYIKGP